MSSIDQAMLLCGGLGTRLRELFPNLPKALVPVHGRPFITYMIEGLRDQGISRIHLAAGYRADQIKAWAENTSISGITITVSIEPSPLGTAGGIKYAFPFMSPEKFTLVLNGDSLLPNAQIQDLQYARQANSSLKAVLAAVEMTERGQYGTIEINDHNVITEFREKAGNEQGFVNGGIYLLDRDLVEGIPDGVSVSIEKDVFPVLTSNSQLGAVKVPGPLLDMGTPQGLQWMEHHITHEN